MKKKEIIVVAFHMGRSGTSALMGLLSVTGVNSGDLKKMPKPNEMNPKGFFELKSQQEFLSKKYKNIYPDISKPPFIEEVDEIGKKYYREYEKLIKEEFTEYPIAIKSQRMLTLPFLNQLKEEYDIKVIYITRNPIAQAYSIKNIWDKHRVEKYTIEFILEWLSQWQNFAEEINQFYGFETLTITFDDLLKNTIKESIKIRKYLNIEEINEEAINKWIDVSLTTKKNIS